MKKKTLKLSRLNLTKETVSLLQAGSITGGGTVVGDSRCVSYCPFCVVPTTNNVVSDCVVCQSAQCTNVAGCDPTISGG